VTIQSRMVSKGILNILMKRYIFKLIIIIKLLNIIIVAVFKLTRCLAYICFANFLIPYLFYIFNFQYKNCHFLLIEE